MIHLNKAMFSGDSEICVYRFMRDLTNCAQTVYPISQQNKHYTQKKTMDFRTKLQYHNQVWQNTRPYKNKKRRTSWAQIYKTNPLVYAATSTV